ncbi:MAG: response regulator [Nitrospirota bacterium]|nr:MAG: response regulator [Nitrospirota bacterium]
MLNLNLRNKLLLFALGAVLILGIVTLISVKVTVHRLLSNELMVKGQFITHHLAVESSRPLLTENYFDLTITVKEYPGLDKDVSYAFIESGEGDVIAHSFESGFPVELRGINRPASGEEFSTVSIETNKGSIVDIAYRIMGSDIGFAHVGMNRDHLIQNVRSVTNIIMRIILGALIIGAISSIFLAIRITKPLSKLVHASKMFGKGDLDKRVNINTKDEIGELAETFNFMADNLSKSDEMLRIKVNEHEKAEEFIKNILETVEVGIIVIDRDFTVTSVNKAYCNQTKMDREDIIGKKCYKVSHAYDSPCFEEGEDCAVKRTFESGMPDESVHIHTDSFGSSVHVELRSYPLRGPSGEVRAAIETLNDVTDRLKLEDQLRQAQKMEAIGQLAGGIAHDFNNILTAIIGYSSILKEKIGEDEELAHYVENVLSSSERAAALTRGLLAYSRKQVLQPKPVEINKLIRNLARFLKPVIGEDVELKTELSKDDLLVMADRNQIEQVLLNLAANARDAMPRGGTLMIETSMSSIDDAFIRSHGYGEIGKYVHIVISDTGTGIDEKVLEKVFDPFFTTKEVGKGTGLGLSMVYGIVKQHKGYITAYSEKGKGTAFKVYLPLVESWAEDEEEVEVIRDELKGSETILLGEDDEVIRRLIKMVLQDSGYRVIEGEDGDSVLTLFRKHKDQIDLLLLDVIMPKRTGKDAYDVIKGERPDIKVLFISGYTSEFIKREKIIEEGAEFVYKPISPAGLLKKIREVIDS